MAADAPSSQAPRSIHVTSRTRLKVPVALAGGLVAWNIWTASDDGTVLCPFRRCTGGYCPGCGATRAAGRMVRGDLSGSWSQHPIVAILIVEVVLLGLIAMFNPTLGSKPLEISTRPSTRPDAVGPWHQRHQVPRAVGWRSFTKPLALGNGVVLVAIYAARLATGDIPLPFA